jgi:hypothetical protein
MKIPTTSGITGVFLDFVNEFWGCALERLHCIASGWSLKRITLERDGGLDEDLYIRSHNGYTLIRRAAFLGRGDG